MTKHRLNFVCHVFPHVGVIHRRTIWKVAGVSLDNTEGSGGQQIGVSIPPNPEIMKIEVCRRLEN